MDTAAVIPFFQRERGLLKRAVESALAQEGVRPVIIIVDDGSPVSASDELGSLASEKAVQVFTQPNAGPAAARNRALDNLSDDVKFVAFLDSDDVWARGHLQNAKAAFTRGADLYFSDWQRPGEATRFALPGVIRPEGDPLPGGDCLFRYRGDLFDAILRCAPIGTSGVVYRRAIAPQLRFHEDLHGPEDNVFWMALAKAAGAVVYTTNCEAFYGTGINIAAGATWRDPRVLKHLAQSARMHRRLPRLYELTNSQSAWNDRWRATLRRDYSRNLLAMLWHRQSIDWSVLGDYVSNEPRLLLSIARAGVWGVIGW